MAALRVEIVNLSTLNNAPIGDGYDIFLDCWQWQLIATNEPSGWTINGISAVNLFSKLGDRDASLDKFGGYVDEKGKPVNFNSTLRFVNASGGAWSGALVKVYYDHNLPQPD